MTTCKGIRLKLRESPRYSQFLTKALLFNCLKSSGALVRVNASRHDATRGSREAGFLRATLTSQPRSVALLPEKIPEIRPRERSLPTISRSSDQNTQELSRRRYQPTADDIASWPGALLRRAKVWGSMRVFGNTLAGSRRVGRGDMASVSRRGALPGSREAGLLPPIFHPRSVAAITGEIPEIRPR